MSPSCSPASGANRSGRWDKVGIAGSLACTVHCMAAPLLLLALPALGSAWTSPWVHGVFAAVLLPLALAVVVRGFCRHGRHAVLVWGVCGAVLITCGLVVPHQARAGAAVHEHAESGADMGHVACESACCPTLQQVPETGETRLHVPAGSVLTMLGSGLLVLGHVLNLRGCRACQHAADSVDAVNRL